MQPPPSCLRGSRMPDAPAAVLRIGTEDTPPRARFWHDHAPFPQTAPRPVPRRGRCGGAAHGAGALHGHGRGRGHGHGPGHGHGVGGGGAVRTAPWSLACPVELVGTARACMREARVQGERVRTCVCLNEGASVVHSLVGSRGAVQVVGPGSLHTTHTRYRLSSAAPSQISDSRQPSTGAGSAVGRRPRKIAAASPFTGTVDTVRLTSP